MGTYVSFDRHIEIANKTWVNGALKQTGYMDIDNQMIEQIVSNHRLKWIQIKDYLPDEGYEKIDQILLARPDIVLRLYHFWDYKQIDISFLSKIPHLERLRIDCIEFKDNHERINLSVLTGLNLKSLHIDCFDLRDYNFIKNLSDDLEELAIWADTMGAGILFDCKWLLKYKKLHTLWLGKKAKRNLECINQLYELKSLSLRGIKIANFSFLKQMNLDKLALLWNSNSDLHELADLKGLKEIELWRINKLEDVSFIGSLTNLEVIKLQDLKHVTILPDLSKHTKLQRIILIDTGVKTGLLPDYLKDKVCNWDDR